MFEPSFAASGIPDHVRYVIAVGLVLILAGALAGVKFTQIKGIIDRNEAMAKAGPFPETVGSAVAKEDEWEKKLSAVASIATARGVTVSNEVAGMVSAIRFESGAQVKRGQVLVELDTSVERAQLASVQARRDNAKISAGRTRSLVQQEALPQQQLDSDEATLKSLSADATALSAQIDRKIVRAPFDGRLGIRLVNLGQYLNAGTPITDLQAVDAVYVDFTLPQKELPTLTVGLPVRINEAAGGPQGEATIAAIDPTVDEVTRSIKVRAAIPKAKDNTLRPGMYVTVSVVLPEKRRIVIVPATAVVHAAFGDSVFIIEDRKDESGAVVKGQDGKPAKVARQQFVKTDERRGDFVSITDGVKAGQEVVVAGAFKLRNGAPVAINNSVKPEPKLAPTPENR